jgi:ABC-type antimicrobial peptide transport system permease subunit
MKRLPKEINFIRSIITSIIEKHYLSKANHEKISLHNLITFSITNTSTEYIREHTKS